MQTTLKKIRAHNPCASGWTRLLIFLGKTKGDDEALLLSTVLQSNGLNDTLWCLQAVDGFEREKRLFAVWCARQVQRLITDPRSLAALDVVEQFANGQASLEELGAAAADAATNAAWDAAWAYAREAARDAAWAAWAATWADATDAATDAANAAYRATSRATSRASQIQELKRVLACTEAGIDPYPPQKALGIHRDPESIATVFSIEHQGVRTVIDVENGKPNVRVEYED